MMIGEIPTAVRARYQVQRLRATGGSGRAYLASQIALSRPVVIKVLTIAGLGAGVEHQRFIQEAQLTARLDHPNIVTLLDFGVDEDVPWIVYEYINQKMIDSGLEEWSRGTTAAFGPMLLGRFRLELSDLLSGFPLEGLSPEMLARLAQALFLVSQFSEELIRNLEEERRLESPDKARASLGTLTRYQAEFTGLKQLLLDQAAMSSGARATTAAFLAAVVRFGSGRNPEREWFERQDQAKEVLTLLEKVRPLSPEISKDLHHLVEKPYIEH